MPDDPRRSPIPDSTPDPHNPADEAVLATSRRHTRRAFLGAGLAASAGVATWYALNHAPAEGDLPAPFRQALRFNARVARTVFDDRALAPTYPLSRAETLRVNGIFGLKQALVPESWRLQLVGTRSPQTHPRFSPDVTAWQYRYTADATHEDPGHDTKTPPMKPSSPDMAPAEHLQQAQQREMGPATPRPKRGNEEAGESRSTLPPGTPGLLLPLDDLHQFPRHELVTQFKCIEGWSQVVHWAGLRLADLLDAFPPALIADPSAPGGHREPRYIYMETPNGDYYTGYDLHVCRHPQSLLVTEMMGAPLTQFHGAPLRLHMPTKYGYKQIKRIGLIAYTDTHPDDYWTRLGYDWYAGL